MNKEEIEQARANWSKLDPLKKVQLEAEWIISFALEQKLESTTEEENAYYTGKIAACEDLLDAIKRINNSN